MTRHMSARERREARFWPTFFSIICLTAWFAVGLIEGSL